MQSFKAKPYCLSFIDTNVYKTMTNKQKVVIKCNDNYHLCGADIELRSQRRFQLYNILFLLFENMTKSSQILSTGNPI